MPEFLQKIASKNLKKKKILKTDGGVYNSTCLFFLYIN